MLFRLVRESELALVQAIHSENVEWLLGRGVRQWTKAMPTSVFSERIAKGGQYCLEIAGEVTAIVSVCAQQAGPWTPELGSGERWFLGALCTANHARGQGYGTELLHMALNHARSQTDSVFLDCVVGNGFLPAFYRAAGFEEVTRRTVEYPTGPFDMVLMQIKFD